MRLKRKTLNSLNLQDSLRKEIPTVEETKFEDLEKEFEKVMTNLDNKEKEFSILKNKTTEDLAK